MLGREVDDYVNWSTAVGINKKSVAVVDDLPTNELDLQVEKIVSAANPEAARPKQLAQVAWSRRA
jgi:hypothetical protein